MYGGIIVKGIMKSFTLVASVSLVSIAAISGCGAASAANNSSRGSQNQSSTSGALRSAASVQQEDITFAWWTTPLRTQLTEQAIQLFEKKYPYIHVTLEYEPWSSYWTKLATQAASGTLPDVMQMDASYLNQYVSNGSLMNLTKSAIDTSQLSAQTVNMGKVGGKLYAIPVGVNTFCEIVNPAILKKAGISFNPNKSYSWDQFANILIEVHKKLPNVYGSTDDIWQGAPLAYWARSHGQSMYSSNGKSIGMSEKTLAGWFAYWLNLQNKGGVEPAQANAAWDHTDPTANPFVKGQVAFTYASIGQDGNMEQLLGKPIERAIFPDWNQPSKPNILHPSMYWTVWSKTKYPDAAEKLVNFLENNEQVSKIFKNDRGVTANQKNRAADEKAFGGLVQIQDDFMDKVQKVSSVVPLDPPNASQLGNLLENIGQEVTFKKLTPDQAAQQFIQQANAILQQG